MTGGFPGLPGTTTSGTYTQTVYAPDGTEIGTIRNGTLVSATIPLKGGGDAVYNGAGFSYFRHKDWLGSSRLATTWTHGVYSKTAYGPFGENYNQAGTADPDFTGQTQDSASSLLDFPFRKYDSTAGRWTAPDPAGWSVVALNNPQTFNRYAYVLNNPMSYVDPSGLDACATINDDGTATIYNAAFVDCEAEGEENSIYIESDVAVTGIGVDANGDLTVYGTSDGSLYNPDGTDYDVAQSVTTFSDGTSSSIVPGMFYSPSTQYVYGVPTVGPASALNTERSGYEGLFCLGDALKSNAKAITLDLVGLIPEAEGFTKIFENTAGYQLARAVGNNAGYRGVVATQYGIKTVAQGKGAVNMINLAFGLDDTSAAGRISTAATIAGFIPGAGTIAATASLAVDAYKVNKQTNDCVAKGTYD